MLEMDLSEITWYSLDESLNVQEHGVVSFPEAISIIDRYFSQLKPFYETGEEALASTMFGFSRTESTFIEICIHSPSQISFKYEMPGENIPWYLKLWKGVQGHELTLKSREELIAKVQQFFTLAPENYRKILGDELSS